MEAIRGVERAGVRGCSTRKGRVGRGEGRREIGSDMESKK